MLQYSFNTSISVFHRSAIIAVKISGKIKIA